MTILPKGNIKVIYALVSAADSVWWDEASVRGTVTCWRTAAYPEQTSFINTNSIILTYLVFLLAVIILK